MKLFFDYEKDTKNTVRFSEREAGTTQHQDHPGYNVVGTLYIQKAAYVLLGSPQSLCVEVKPA